MNTAQANTAFTIKLADGTPAQIRPVVPDDDVRLAEGMTRLSPESRLFRFFNVAPSLSHEQLCYLTDVDQQNHVAWIAVNPSLPKQPGLGIARFVRLDTKPSTAEMAFTVIDRYQGLGLGAYLLATLYLRAVELGLQTLRGVVLPENRRVIQWLLGLGATSQLVDGSCQLELPVSANDAVWHKSPAIERFGLKIEEVRRLLHAASTRTHLP